MLGTTCLTEMRREKYPGPHRPVTWGIWLNARMSYGGYQRIVNASALSRSFSLHDSHGPAKANGPCWGRSLHHESGLLGAGLFNRYQHTTTILNMDLILF